MIESSFRAPLVATVGTATLPAPRLSSARVAAVALAAVAVSADPEHRLTSHAEAHPLTKHHLAMKIHRLQHAGLDNSDRSWQVRTSLFVWLPAEGRQTGRPAAPTAGHPNVSPAFEEELYTFGSDVDARRMIGAFGADDVTRLRYTGESSENDDFR